MYDKSKFNLYAKRILATDYPFVVVTEKVLNYIDILVTRFIKRIVKHCCFLVKSIKKNTVMKIDIVTGVKYLYNDEKLLTILFQDINEPDRVIPESKMKRKMKVYSSRVRLSRESIIFLAGIVQNLIHHIWELCANQVDLSPREITTEYLIAIFNEGNLGFLLE